MDRLSAFLFDLDGTLVVTGEANFLAYSAALAEVGVTVERPAFERLANGRNWRQFLPEILRAANIDADPAAIARRKAALYPNAVDRMRLNRPLLDLATSVRPAIRTGIVTTASATNCSMIVEAFGFAASFDVIVTGDDVIEHKPAPEAYLIAAQRLGVEPGACLAFEDSDIGIASARAAGVRVVRVVFENISTGKPDASC